MTTLSRRAKASLAVKVPITIVLLLIALVVVACRPWSSHSELSGRTITVRGSATILSEPDEYIFYPQYSFANVDSAAALKEATAKNAEITDYLHKLGVETKKIKADTSGFQNTRYYSEPNNGKTDQTTYNDSLTITVKNKILAQKVQDYLITTSPTGSVSPQSGFSENLKKSLENRGRSQAALDARAKAEESAKNLGFTIGPVKSVEDGSADQLIRPYALSGDAKSLSIETKQVGPQSFDIQPGENTLTYNVTVIYYMR